MRPRRYRVRPIPGILLAALLALSCSTGLAQESSSVTCPSPGTWLRLGQDGGRSPAQSNAIVAEMAGRDVVLLGEEHTDADHHRWQLHTLAALHGQHPRMVIGFEMFPRRAQPVLDRWVAGELSVAQLLRDTNWHEVWRFPAELYLPLFEFARLHRIPMLALNVDQSLIRDIGARGWDSVEESRREGVSRPAAPSAGYRRFLFEVWREHDRAPSAAGSGAAEDSPAFRNFVDAQLTWDRAMAQFLAERQRATTANGRVLVIGIMGSGHLRNGHGVPHQLRDLGVASVGVLLPARVGADCSDLAPGLADAVFALAPAAQTPPRRPRLGVSLEQDETGVRLAAVTKGSLAERTGLLAGDVVVEVAGRPVGRMSELITAVNRQPAGTWLPLTVRRGTETIDVVVKFPAGVEPRDPHAP